MKGCERSGEWRGKGQKEMSSFPVNMRVDVIYGQLALFDSKFGFLGVHLSMNTSEREQEIT